MATEERQLREFGNFRLDVQKRVLWHDGEPVNLPLKEVELLCVLTDNVGEVVTKEEILNKIWVDSFVEESNLSRHVYLLRKTFKDHGESEELIQTVPRRGYRFAGEVRLLAPGQVMLEKHSLTQTLIEEIPAGDQEGHDSEKLLRGRALSKLTVAAAALAVIAALGAGVFFIRRATGRTDAATGRERIAGVVGPPLRSIAVLPFSSFVVGDYTAMDDAAARELTESVIARLSAEGHQITPPDAVLAEKMHWNNTLLAGRTLGADAVLTGAIFTSDRDIHLRLHFVSVNGGEVLWAVTYKHPRSELPSLLDSLAQAVTSGLQQLRSAEEYELRAARHTANREAYQLYLQGRFLWEMREDVFSPMNVFVEHTASTERLKEAIALDPNFAMAYVGLADHYKTFGYSTPERRLAEELAQKAIALDPALAEPHATLGFIRMFHYWDWAGAESEFKRALELDPNCVTAHQWYALFHALQGNQYKAAGEIAHAFKLAPNSLILYADMAEIHYYGGRFNGYGGALDLLLDVVKKYPHSMAHNNLIHAYWMDGQFEKLDELRTNVKRPLSPQDHARELAGPRKGSPAFDAITHHVTYNHARWHAVLNQREEALDLLERAYRDHHFFIIYIKAEPFFDSLRNEPRFQELLRKLGFAS